MPWDQGPGLRYPGALVPGFPSKELTGYLINQSGPVSLELVSESCTSDSDDPLTLVLIETYITLMIRIGHQMSLLLKKF